MSDFENFRRNWGKFPRVYGNSKKFSVSAPPQTKKSKKKKKKNFKIFFHKIFLSPIEHGDGGARNYGSFFEKSMWPTPERNSSKKLKIWFFTKNFSKSTWAREYCRARELGEFGLLGWLETLSGGHETWLAGIDVRPVSTGVRQREAGRGAKASLTGLA